MKISDRYFSIPPHLVVLWEHVSCIYSKSLSPTHVKLTIYLTSGEPLSIDAIEEEYVSALFEGFRRFQDQRQQVKLRVKAIWLPAAEMAGSLSGFSPENAPGKEQLEHFTKILRHNPQMHDLPLFPKDVLIKIAHTARLFLSDEDASEMSQPHPGCYCAHCQVVRAIQSGLEQGRERVDERDLRFNQWHIQALSEELYLVSNTSDPSQTYEVSLKPSVSCTCGIHCCPHVEAVLRT